MTVSMEDMARARENVDAMLKELQLDAYLFEVEPDGGDTWEVRIDCGAAGDWKSYRLSAPGEQLLGGEDSDARRGLLEQWRRALAGCSGIS